MEYSSKHGYPSDFFDFESLGVDGALEKFTVGEMREHVPSECRMWSGRMVSGIPWANRQSVRHMLYEVWAGDNGVILPPKPWSIIMACGERKCVNPVHMRCV